MQNTIPLCYLKAEALSLLTRLERLKPFSLQTPMVPGAAVGADALQSIEAFLAFGRSALRTTIADFVSRLCAARPPAAEAQKAFAVIRMRFNNILSQIDIFADVLNQRSEHGTGVWVAGLDAVAADALRLPGDFPAPPPVICYLDRGHGAAIRRARTRLPGGAPNPVAIVRVPRERMIGHGIASSLVHEVGHQGAALLGLPESIRPILKGLQRRETICPWTFWERWITEIIPDFWSAAKLGIGATAGLMGVVGLPRAFVFRISLDVHPFPYIRVKLSCALGNALYPHPHWRRAARLWESLYPVDGLSGEKRKLISILEEAMDGFVTLLINHRPRSLKGLSLKEAFHSPDRTPERLAAHFAAWRTNPDLMHVAPPTLVFAVIGQARANNMISPRQEGAVLSSLLSHWALSRTRLQGLAAGASVKRRRYDRMTASARVVSIY